MRSNRMKRARESFTHTNMNDSFISAVKTRGA